jgi:hypothetical protein
VGLINSRKPAAITLEFLRFAGLRDSTKEEERGTQDIEKTSGLIISRK